MKKKSILNIISVFIIIVPLFCLTSARISSAQPCYNYCYNSPESACYDLCYNEDPACDICVNNTCVPATCGCDDGACETFCNNHWQTTGYSSAQDCICSGCYENMECDYLYDQCKSCDQRCSDDCSGNCSGSCDSSCDAQCADDPDYVACYASCYETCYPSCNDPCYDQCYNNNCADSDFDGVPNGSDNCPDTVNPGQEDWDGDGLGDACDNCRFTSNGPLRGTCTGASEFNGAPCNSNGDCGQDGFCSMNQEDADGDGMGDACDPCPEMAVNTDIDNDCIPDSIDNCPYDYNPDQADSNGNGIGDVCEYSGIWFVDSRYSLPGNPVRNGKSWGQAFQYIQNAIDAAAVNDEIWVKQGTHFLIYSPALYNPIKVNKIVSIYGGFAGGETLRDQRNWKTNITIVDGDHNYNLRNLFFVTANATIDGITLKRGNAFKTNPPDYTGYRGGGMYINNCSPTIINCTFTQNKAKYEGGGIYIFYGYPTIKNCTFSDNTALGDGTGSGYGGGGIYAFSGASQLYRSTIDSCVFNNNSATLGGGIGMRYPKGSVIRNCVFSGNSSSAGAGYYIFAGRVDITNCTFSGNKNSAAVYFDFTDSGCTVTNCILWGDTGASPKEIRTVSSTVSVSHSNVDQDGYADSNGNIRQNPLFLGSADYHVTAASPCINAGSNSAPSLPAKDLDGNNRILCGIVDMGAYEYNDTDCDGVTDVEESGPAGNNPNYDGNGDTVPDSQQGIAASTHTADGQQYVTIASPDGTSLSNVAAINNPSPTDAPEDVPFPYGFFSYSVSGLAAGAATTVTVYLPPGAPPVTTYYKYGPETGNTTPHWYEFMYDGLTQTGAEINGNIITLHFVDGKRGDADLTANGTIVDPGAPGITQAPPITTTTTTSPATTVTPTTTTTITPTAIELATFVANAGDKKVTLIWKTETETDNAGFNLYRADSQNRKYSKINSSLIPAHGSSTQGASYEFVDTGVRNRKTYYYKLEDIDLNGKSTMYGPVSAMPRLIYWIGK